MRSKCFVARWAVIIFLTTFCGQTATSQELNPVLHFQYEEEIEEWSLKIIHRGSEFVYCIGTLDTTHAKLEMIRWPDGTLALVYQPIGRPLTGDDGGKTRITFDYKGYGSVGLNPNQKTLKLEVDNGFLRKFKSGRVLGFQTSPTDKTDVFFLDGSRRMADTLQKCAAEGQEQVDQRWSTLGLGHYKFNCLTRKLNSRTADFCTALVDFEGASNEQKAKALHRRAHAHLKAGRTADAIADAQQAISIDDQANFYDVRAMAHAAQGDFGTAIKDFSHHIENRTGVATAWLSYRQVAGGTTITQFYEYGQIDVAAAARERADYELVPIGVVAHLERGKAFQELGKYDEAIADYTTAIVHFNIYAEAYYRRAQVSSIRGQKDSALDDIDKAISLDPENQGYKTLKASIEDSADAPSKSAADKSIDYQVGIVKPIGLPDEYAEKYLEALARMLESADIGVASEGTEFNLRTYATASDLGSGPLLMCIVDIVDRNGERVGKITEKLSLSGEQSPDWSNVTDSDVHAVTKGIASKVARRLAELKSPKTQDAEKPE